MSVQYVVVVVGCLCCDLPTRLVGIFENIDEAVVAAVVAETGIDLGEHRERVVVLRSDKALLSEEEVALAKSASDSHHYLSVHPHTRTVQHPIAERLRGTLFECDALGDSFERYPDLAPGLWRWDGEGDPVRLMEL